MELNHSLQTRYGSGWHFMSSICYDISLTLFMKSRRCKSPPFLCCRVGFFFCWRILCWTFARFSKPINVCFLSWGIVGFHIMDSSTALTAINSQISNWSSSSLQIILSAASNVQIVLWIRYTSNNCNGTNQFKNGLTNS